MSAYTKLFQSIITSTLWRESPETKVVWVTMMALADKHGIVEASVPGLAALSHVSIEECEEALNLFMSPDKWSRTPDNGGRRIAPVDGGWELLNHEKYRLKMTEDERREYERLRKQRLRERQRKSVPECPGHVPDKMGCVPTNDGKGPKTPFVPYSEEDAKAEAEKEVSKPSVSQGSKLPGPAENGFARFWEAYGHKVDKADASKAWAKAIKRADPETIIREAQWHAANRGPVPHAATWLNGSRWEDSHEAVLAEAKRFSGAKPTPPRYVPDKKPQDFSLESTRAKAERERAEAQKAREKAEKLNQEFIANAQKMAGDGAVNGLVEALNRAVKR